MACPGVHGLKQLSSAIRIIDMTWNPATLDEETYASYHVVQIAEKLSKELSLSCTKCMT